MIQNHYLPTDKLKALYQDLEPPYLGMDETETLAWYKTALPLVTDVLIEALELRDDEVKELERDTVPRDDHLSRLAELKDELAEARAKIQRFEAVATRGFRYFEGRGSSTLTLDEAELMDDLWGFAS